MGKGKRKAKKKQSKKQQKKVAQVITEKNENPKAASGETAAAEEKKNEEKPTEEKKTVEKPAEEKKAAEKPAEEKEVQKTETAEAQEKPVSRKKRVGMILAGSAAGILLVSYAVGMVYLRDKFLPNTVINGIDASFDTVEEAEQKVADMVEKYEIDLEERDGIEETITADQMGYHYVSRGEIQNFRKEQNLYLWPLSLWKKNEYRFSSSTAFDEELLKEVVNGLECFSRKVEEAPTDAYMKFNGTTYEMVKETQGKKVKKKKLLKVLREAISENEDEVSLETEGCYAKPGITEDNRLLNKKIENLNKYAKTRIVYKFGAEQEILDGSIVSKWLSCDEQGNVILDEEKVALYVDYLAEEYDTSGKAREFVTHEGDTVTVKGGKYGWLIDREAETEELISWVRTGTRRTRIPIYAQTAVSRENSDLGDSYVEVDLSNQHLWMYVDGEEIVSTDVVSGTYTNSSKCTPAGTYAIYYKKSPAVLRGYTPGDTYESHVSYWMPFNGGIGLHDANWRGSFGGNIYKYSGSHGCINLPTDAAREIYENIYAGMPVICYY